MSVIKVATCQHPLSADIDINMAYIKRQIKTAASAGADIMHFPECSITGYAGLEFTEYEIRNNQQVEEALSIVKALARKYKIFIDPSKQNRERFFLNKLSCWINPP